MDTLDKPLSELKLSDLADDLTLEDLLGLLQRGHVALHADDSSADVKSMQYNTAVHHYGSEGNIVASTAADAKHNHWGVYTRRHPLGKSPKRDKRMEISGGSVDTTLRTNSQKGDNILRQTAAGQSRHIFQTTDSKVNWLLTDDHIDTGEPAYRLFDLENDYGILDVHLREDGPILDLLGNPVRNVGRVE